MLAQGSASVSSGTAPPQQLTFQQYSPFLERHRLEAIRSSFRVGSQLCNLLDILRPKFVPRVRALTCELRSRASGMEIGTLNSY